MARPHVVAEDKPRLRELYVDHKHREVGDALVHACAQPNVTDVHLPYSLQRTLAIHVPTSITEPTLSYSQKRAMHTTCAVAYAVRAATR